MRHRCIYFFVLAMWFVDDMPAQKAISKPLYDDPVTIKLTN